MTFENNINIEMFNSCLNIGDFFKENTCNICLTECVEEISLSCCNNHYCKYCLLKWLNINKSCCLCRGEVYDLKILGMLKKRKVENNIKLESGNERFIRERNGNRTYGFREGIRILSREMGEMGGIRGWFRGNILGIWDNTNLGIV